MIVESSNRSVLVELNYTVFCQIFFFLVLFEIYVKNKPELFAVELFFFLIFNFNAWCGDSLGAKKLGHPFYLFFKVI